MRIDVFLPMVFAAIIAGAYLLNKWAMSRRHEWHVVTRYKPVQLVDGSYSTGTNVWGRFIGGSWQYRAMTTDELNEHNADMSL